MFRVFNLSCPKGYVIRHSLAIIIYVACIIAALSEIEEGAIEIFLVENWHAAHSVILLSVVRMFESCVHLVERVRDMKRAA